MFDAEVTPSDRILFRELVKRRTQGMPVAYLVGKKEFFSIELLVDSRVLIPRPETEVLVSRALAILPKDQPARFLDVGTGSGAIAIAIAKNRPLASGIAIDIDPDALAVATANVERLGLGDRIELRQGTLLTTLTADERFHLVASNPPYIRQNEMATLPPDVRDYEPKQALLAGEDGLSVLTDLIEHAPEYLHPGGSLLLEFGIDHAPTLKRSVESHGKFASCDIINDDARIPRVLAARTFHPA
jgi:release factor glutamine methyltransferase